MYSQTLRPGRLLGDYPERGSEADGWAEQLAHRTAGRLIGRSQTGKRQAGRFLDQVAREGRAIAKLDADGIGGSVQTLRQALAANGLRPDLVARGFALVREVAYRELGLRHFDSQVIGGWIMVNGMLAEMGTGEGKTLAATLPASVAALAGIPVHVITVNDYLAVRDEQTMAPLYRALGITTAAVSDSDLDPAVRRRAYASDITYCTNKQVAFDYLRDRQMLRNDRGRIGRNARALAGAQTNNSEPLLRGLCFGIVDEADSVLIDDARTPLKLSAKAGAAHDAENYRTALDLSAALDDNKDFRIDHDSRRIVLTESGRDKLADAAAGRAGIWTRPRRREELIRQALAATHLYQADRDYLVRDGKVEIIDENTGRTMADRSWEMGLHQLIEAREGCEVSGHDKTLATITYQRFFRRYLRLAAMSGTASETAGELWAVYGLGVVRVPEHRPSRRLGKPAQFFPDAAAKWRAVAGRARELSASGRPVLLGTRTVEASEVLSKSLSNIGVAHRVLNARQDREEADIIARAGEPGCVTVATNMAGRGTDIRLAPGVAERGGLHVISTEINTARRIDRQLFGRCARQGDPGSWEFMLSFDDEVLASHTPAFVRMLLNLLRASGSLRLQRFAGATAMRLAQRSQEGRHRRARKNLLRQDRSTADALAFSGPME